MKLACPLNPPCPNPQRTQETIFILHDMIMTDAFLKFFFWSIINGNTRAKTQFEMIRTFQWMSDRLLMPARKEPQKLITFGHVCNNSILFYVCYFFFLLYFSVLYPLVQNYFVDLGLYTSFPCLLTKSLRCFIVIQCSISIHFLEGFKLFYSGFILYKMFFALRGI